MKTLAVRDLAKGRAKLDAGLDRNLVLGDLGIDAPTWMREEEALLSAMANDVERGELSSLDAYRTSYQATWTELTGVPLTGTSSERTGATDGAAEASAIARPFNGASATTPVPVEVQKASFQKTPSPGPMPSPHPPALPPIPPPRVGSGAALEETAQVDLSKIIASIPFPKKEPLRGSLEAALGSFEAVLKAPTPEGPSSTGTDDLDMSAVRRDVTPFGSPSHSTRSVPQPPNEPIAVAPPNSGHPSTMLLRDDPHPVVGRPTLPFQAVGPQPSGDRALEATAALGDAQAFNAIVQRHLGFPASASANAPISIGPRADVTQPPNSRAAAAALPFDSSALMPMEQYAAISVALETEGDPESTFRRIGITPATWMATVRGYARLMSENPAQQAALDAIARKVRGNAR